jgi:hypothetical protein
MTFRREKVGDRPGGEDPRFFKLPDELFEVNRHER